MRRVHTAAGGGYDVLIERGLLARCGEVLADAMGARQAALVADDRVLALHGETVRRSLESSGWRASVVTFPAGERSKRLDTFASIVEGIAEAGLSRSDIVVALGGGVAGDMAGFAAACYMRGIRYAQLPTTLLAMIDSSVGGKTAVDLAAGKNLCGAFWQPHVVICDPCALSTLPHEEQICGIGEMIKYGIGFDAELFDELEARGVDLYSSLASGDDEPASRLIERCVAAKAAIVSADERDGGERQKLNLGHTAAHAIERLSDFGISHGRAVAIGLGIVARAAVKRGLLAPDVRDRLESMLSAFGAGDAVRWSAREMADAARSDKKRRGGTMTIVVPTGVGRCELMDIPAGELESFFADGLGGEL